MRSVLATVGEPVYERLVALSRAEDTSMARITRRALAEFLESDARDADSDFAGATHLKLRLGNKVRKPRGRHQ
jgi:hypothetical protein